MLDEHLYATFLPALGVGLLDFKLIKLFSSPGLVLAHRPYPNPEYASGQNVPSDLVEVASVRS